MLTLVGFDLDGTLVDSRRDLADSANELVAGYGAPPLAEDAVAAMVGDGARQLVSRVLAASGRSGDLESALDRFLTIYAGRLVAHTRPYPGIPEAIEALADAVPLAVLTNKPEGLSRRLLDAFALSRFFRRVVGGDSGFPRKPDPAGLRHLIGSLGSVPAECVFVGDSMIDVETARAAGATALVARYGFGHLRAPIALEGSEMAVDDAGQLARTLGRLVERRV